MRLYRQALEQWEAALPGTLPTMANGPDAFQTVMEQRTLQYIHLQERCIMSMLWIVSNRDPAQLDVARFLTRRIVHRVDPKTLLTPQAVARAQLDVARFFDTKQTIIHAGCETASESAQRTFFPPESMQLRRATPTGGLVPLDTLTEYARYLETTKRLLSL